MAYERDNVFAKILRNEIPCTKVYEDAHALAFHDINAQRPVHVLIIPKGEYSDMNEFAAKASADELAGFMRAIGKVAEATGVAGTGYRLISNTGVNGHQEVPHLHFHIVGGAPSGPMLKRIQS